jgi:hypothetical protein
VGTRVSTIAPSMRTPRYRGEMAWSSSVDSRSDAIAIVNVTRGGRHLKWTATVHGRVRRSVHGRGSDRRGSCATDRIVRLRHSDSRTRSSGIAERIHRKAALKHVDAEHIEPRP